MPPPRFAGRAATAVGSKPLLSGRAASLVRPPDPPCEALTGCLSQNPRPGRIYPADDEGIMRGPRLPTYAAPPPSAMLFPCPGQEGSMLQLHHIKARIIRLRELTEGLGREVKAWQAQESPLLPQERRQYLDGIQDGLAGLDAAGVVLAGVVGRLENG